MIAEMLELTNDSCCSLPGESEHLHADVIDWEAVRLASVEEVWVLHDGARSTQNTGPPRVYNIVLVSLHLAQCAGGRSDSVPRHAHDAGHPHPGKPPPAPMKLPCEPVKLV